MSPRLLAVREPGEACYSFRTIEGEVDDRRLGRVWTTPFTTVHAAPLLVGVRPADKAGEHVIAVLRLDGSVAAELRGASDSCWGLPGAVVWRRSAEEAVVVAREDGKERAVRDARFVPIGRNVGRLMHRLGNGLFALLESDGSDWSPGVEGYLGLRAIAWTSRGASHAGNDAWLIVSRGADGRERLGLLSGDFAKRTPLQHWLTVEAQTVQQGRETLDLLIAHCEDRTYDLVKVYRQDGVDDRIAGLVHAFDRLGTVPNQAAVKERLGEHLAAIARAQRERLAADAAERASIDEHIRVGNESMARAIAERWRGDVLAKYALRWPGSPEALERVLQGTQSPDLRKELTALQQKLQRERATDLAQKQALGRQQTLRDWGDSLVVEWQRATAAPVYERLSLSELWYGRTTYDNGFARHTDVKEIEERNHWLRLDHERRMKQYGSLEQFLRRRLGTQYETYVKLGGTNGR